MDCFNICDKLRKSVTCHYILLYFLYFVGFLHFVVFYILWFFIFFVLKPFYFEKDVGRQRLYNGLILLLNGKEVLVCSCNFQYDNPLYVEMVAIMLPKSPEEI